MDLRNVAIEPRMPYTQQPLSGTWVALEGFGTEVFAVLSATASRTKEAVTGSSVRAATRVHDLSYCLSSCDPSVGLYLGEILVTMEGDASLHFYRFLSNSDFKGGDNKLTSTGKTSHISSDSHHLASDADFLFFALPSAASAAVSYHPCHRSVRVCTKHHSITVGVPVTVPAVG